MDDRHGFNLLHLACCVRCADLGISESHSATMVSLLLDYGLDVESKLPAQDRCTAVFFAVARARNATLIKLLLKRGAKVQNALGGGLFALAWYDDVGNLDLLVKACAKVDVVVGMTPFLAAWTWKKFRAARFLAKRGADVDSADPRSGRTGDYMLALGDACQPERQDLQSQPSAGVAPIVSMDSSRRQVSA